MIVYRYGAKPPTKNAERVAEQMLLAHRYRNLLTEIELARRGAVRATPDAEARVAIEERVKAFIKTARARSGLFWGTYLIIEQAADAQRKSSDPPRFRRWDGAGRVAVQLQHGLAVAAALSCADTRLRIVRQPDVGGIRPGSRRAGRRAELWLRVGSSEDRAPIWTRVEFTLHRPMPLAGSIKWAVLRRDRVGPDYRWSVQFTVAAAPVQDEQAVTDRAGVVAVDLGWRMRPGGQRVGYWQDDAGQHGEFALPASYLGDLDHIRSVGAIRTRLFNDFRDRLAGWTRDVSERAPDWLTREAAALAGWRSPDRLARLAWRWRNARFSGDEGIFGPWAIGANGRWHNGACPRDHNGALDCVQHVECWRIKDRHLHRWYAHGLANILARRDETYRRLAADLARRYAVVVVEKFDLRAVAGRRGLAESASDAENAIADNVSSRRHGAAPGTFRLALVNACRQRSTAVAELPAEYTTQDCADCGIRNDFDAAPAVDHRCSACGTTWDQDRNAARNLLARYAASGSVLPASGQALAGGKSARQQRFSRRWDRSGTAPASADAGCSQSAVQGSRTAGALTSGVEILAQGDLT